MTNKIEGLQVGAAYAAKHTPGPWETTGHGKSNVIAGDFTFLQTNVREAHVASEWQANARLIAAAPDLLAALEELHAANIAAAKRDKGPGYLATNGPGKLLHDKVATTIARARGES